MKKEYIVSITYNTIQCLTYGTRHYFDKSFSKRPSKRPVRSVCVPKVTLIGQSEGETGPPFQERQWTKFAILAMFLIKSVCFLRALRVKKICQTYFNKLFLLIIKRLIFVFIASMNYIFVLSQGSS